jgi:hypothetical protein
MTNFLLRLLIFPFALGVLFTMYLLHLLIPTSWWVPKRNGETLNPS